jgi:hypothetical protein
MAIFNKFNKFTENLCKGKFNFGSDTVKVALTNTSPVATNAVLADITEIAYTNLSSRSLVLTSCAETSGTTKYVVADLVLSASGTVGPFRYIVVYDDTAASDELIGWYDAGTNITLANGETLTLDFDNTNGVFTVA